LKQSGELDYLKRNSLSASQTISSLSSGSGTNSASASGFGQILSQLQNLATSDPAQFKQQTSSIASQLNTMASQSSGFEAQLFQNLSTQFQQASQTGQVPKLAESHHGRHQYDSNTVTSNAAAKSSAGSLTSAASASTTQIAQNANGTYGPENATDPVTAEIQAGAAGVGFGQSFKIAEGWGFAEVV
jgi:hypothetical protein